VLDYEEGWATECVALGAAVRQVLGEGFSCRFGGTDITVAVDDEANRALAEALPQVRLLVASYVVAENAKSLEAGDFEFFETLFRAAEVSTTCLVLETTHRSFPGLVRAARRGAQASGAQYGIQVDFPWVASNNGHSLLLRKSAGCVSAGELEKADSDGCSVEALLERFERDAIEHAKRMQRVDE